MGAEPLAIVFALFDAAIKWGQRVPDSDHVLIAISLITEVVTDFSIVGGNQGVERIVDVLSLGSRRAEWIELTKRRVNPGRC